MKTRIRGIPFMLLVALLLAACSTVKKTAAIQTVEQSVRLSENHEQHEQVAHEDRYLFRNMEQTDLSMLRTEFAEALPEQQATMELPMQILLDLPDGAKFSEQNGRASIEAARRGDRIVMIGKCDSVARRCALYERQVFRQRHDIDSLNRLLAGFKAEQQYASTRAALTEQQVQRVETIQRDFLQSVRWCLAGIILGGLLYSYFMKTNPFKPIVSLIKRFCHGKKA